MNIYKAWCLSCAIDTGDLISNIWAIVSIEASRHTPHIQRRVYLVQPSAYSLEINNSDCGRRWKENTVEGSLVNFPTGFADGFFRRAISETGQEINSTPFHCVFLPPPPIASRNSYINVKALDSLGHLLLEVWSAFCSIHENTVEQSDNAIMSSMDRYGPCTIHDCQLGMRKSSGKDTKRPIS